METTEGNKLIAEFMGAEISDPTRISFALDNKTVVNGMIRFHEDREPFLPRELRYHTSWDWLMTVVEKIESLENAKFRIVIQKTTCVISFTDEDKSNSEYRDGIITVVSAATKIESVWQAVVSFIQLHNQPTQNKER